MNKPKQIWIERDDECPYFYVESELADACPPLVRYVREDEIDSLRAEVEALRLIRCPDGRMHRWDCDGMCKECCNYATDLIDKALRGEGGSDV